MFLLVFFIDFSRVFDCFAFFEPFLGAFSG